ncbi:hypothetical protein [Devosia sp.]|uniref:hypothetical protein n=1 Tax=Devosia sp. TaxID=1871048 RepID=UPI003265BD6D
MRLIPIAVATASLAAAMPVVAADYPDSTQLRPAYSQDWSNGDDQIRFEFGTRYWYSWGNQDAGFTVKSGGVTLGDVNLSVRDNTHLGELHGKIEDLTTQTYLKGIAGIGFSTAGTYSISPASSGSIGASSAIGYAGADFGWLPLGSMEQDTALGGFVGYQYWKDAPDIGTGKYAASFAGGVPATVGDAKDNFDIHALRLGIKGEAALGDKLDVQAEVAAVPYAWVTGTMGGSAPNGFVLPGATVYERAPTALTGHGYGAMGEMMVGFHPTENLVLRVGGRAWYIQGDLEAAVKGYSGGANIDLNLPSNFARIFRYGALFELTGKF